MCLVPAVIYSRFLFFQIRSVSWDFNSAQTQSATMLASETKTHVDRHTTDEKMEEGAEQREDTVLLLSEDEALAKARANPDEALNIYVTYAENDRDNPRNWPKWRKWWITCLVSSLNIVTCVPPVSRLR